MAVIASCCGIPSVIDAAPPIALQLEWDDQIGTSGEDYADAIAIDQSGRVFVAGLTTGSFGMPNAGDADATLIRIDPTSGDALWIRQLGSSSFDRAFDVSVDGLGGVYIAGETYGTLGDQSAAGSTDIFVSKYDFAGAHQWTRQLGTAPFDRGTAVAADTLGNVFVSGYTQGALGAPNAGDFDSVLAKFDSSGGLQWTRQFGTTLADTIFDVAADDQGNAYLAGKTAGVLGDSSFGGPDAFISKFDLSGNRLWTRQFGSTDLDEPTRVALDALGNIYVTGSTQGSLAAPFAGGDVDAFLSKFAADGSPLSDFQLGTIEQDVAYDVSVDSLGNVFICGLTGGNLGGSNGGGLDAFLAKFDSSLHLTWVHQLGTNRFDGAHGIRPDGSGALYLAGNTEGNLAGPAIGDDDVFIMKLREVPEPSGALLVLSAIILFESLARADVCGRRALRLPNIDRR